MTAGDVSLDAVDEFVSFLVDELEIEASLDPADLKLPGIWVQIPQIDFDRLAGPTIQLRLLLIAPDDGPRKAMPALIDLMNKLRTGVDPHGPVVPRTAVLPDTSTLLPALAFPHNLRTNYTEE